MLFDKDHAMSIMQDNISCYRLTWCANVAENGERIPQDIERFTALNTIITRTSKREPNHFRLSDSPLREWSVYGIEE